MLRGTLRNLALWMLAAAVAAPGAALACTGPVEAVEADVAAIQSFVGGRRLLTFTGYSGAGYEQPEVMLEHATMFLRSEDPAHTLVNIGATAEGIGAVYEVAKRMGFTTMGIVSTRAREDDVALSRCADRVFFVRDATWGGFDAESGRLSPTSQAMVQVSSLMVGIGGGDVARDEMLAAKELGKPVLFMPADMNHAVALARAARRGEPPPQSFKGAAHGAMATARRGATSPR